MITSSRGRWIWCWFYIIVMNSVMVLTFPFISETTISRVVYAGSLSTTLLICGYVTLWLRNRPIGIRYTVFVASMLTAMLLTMRMDHLVPAVQVRLMIPIFAAVYTAVTMLADYAEDAQDHARLAAANETPQEGDQASRNLD